MNKIRIVADAYIPFLQGALEHYAEVKYIPGDRIGKKDIENADGLIIRTRTRCDEALLKGSPVKIIATATIGYDHIDTGYCERNNIAWFDAAGCNASSVQQYVASALLSLAVTKKLDLAGKTIGIIGVGNVGSRIASLAQIMGMQTLLNDPPRERREGHGQFVSLDYLLSNSDIVTLHVPVTFEGPDKTWHMADESFFGKLLRETIFLNTARGSVTDSKALKKAIRTGKIIATALDVWEIEPLIDPELLAMIDLATPHIAGYSVEGKANGTASCVRAVSRFFGFDMDDWYPAKIPEPANPLITINGSGKSRQQILCEAVTASYDISQDDHSFRLNPHNFEELRNHYPFRREFSAYSVKISNSDDQTEKTLHRMGFKVIN